jgi:tRNA(adenine34) deaminase
MCLGSAVMYRVSRIVFGCPDPHGGAAGVDRNSISEWYAANWPVIEGGLMKEESYNLLLGFLQKQNTASWKEVLSLFRQMRRKW